MNVMCNVTLTCDYNRRLRLPPGSSHRISSGRRVPLEWRLYCSIVESGESGCKIEVMGGRLQKTLHDPENEWNAGSRLLGNLGA